MWGRMLGAEAERAKEREAAMVEMAAMRRELELMEGALEEGKAAEARLEEELRAALGRAAVAEEAGAAVGLELRRAEDERREDRARMDGEALGLEEGCKRVEAALVLARGKCVEVS